MKKILVIDDDSSVKVLLRDRIRKFGGNPDIVEYACNGEEGIEKYKDIKPAFVFLDMKMPGIDGLETFRRIEDFDDSANVFVVTGYDDDSAANAIRLGVNGYISKNIDYISMMASLVIALDKTICRK